MKRLSKTARRTRQTRVMPHPEAIRPGAWTVSEGQGSVNLRKKDVRVPMLPGEKTRQVQAHEMGHVRFTPATMTASKEAKRFSVPASVIQGLEDSRITRLLAERGIPQDATLIDTESREFMQAMADRAGAVALLAATYGCRGEDEALVRQYANSYHGAMFPAMVDRAIAAVESEADDCLGYLGEAAGRIRDLLEEIDQAMESKTGKTQGEKAAAKVLSPSSRPASSQARSEATMEALEAATASTGDAAEGSMAEVLEGLQAVAARGLLSSEAARREASSPEKLAAAVGGETIADSENTYHHGNLPSDERFREHDAAHWLGLGPVVRWPMSWRLPRRSMPKGRRVKTDAGAIPVAMNRLPVDSRVFAGNKIKNGASGTVLIDASGSMHLDAADIHRMIAAIPAATVAMYSGAYLTVIAEKGRAVTLEELERALQERRPGSNASDCPSLRWLAAQKGPRFWVTDGGVTGDGNGGYVTAAMMHELVQVVGRARILRVSRMEAVTRRYGK